MQSKTLTDVIKEHRRSKSVNYTDSKYACICGEPVPSNSHHRQAEHIAAKILERFDVKPKDNVQYFVEQMTRLTKNVID